MKTSILTLLAAAGFAAAAFAAFLSADFFSFSAFFVFISTIT